ncbi:ribosome small subunit-dependent GTPase A [Camelliibacillus cellulosilyticus]|uniref:Small ribosomal subunit biogenesis GTPase RsgA n=1 Tax=Camelliibacillus cellulosilyticus TaxID=2174486 RepID=A0ABV9GHH8_9BACL
MDTEAETRTAARIAVEHKGIYRLYCEQGELFGRMSGKLRTKTEEGEPRPAVGDWVVISARPDEGQATIHSVLPRFSKFSRQMAGQTTAEQIVAANINTAFLVMSLNRDFNLRRLERYLLTAWESGATPVIILSKADLCDNVDEKVNDIAAIAFGVPIHVISAATGDGLDALTQYIQEGRTIAFIGSSGVGKSTLINQLYGAEILETGDIREDDDRGRHTTTHRELIVLPNGGIVIDTPGMRELQLWDVGDSLSSSFEDIERLADQCRFRDCTHGNEPGCRVKQALSSGELDVGRFRNYLKLQRELAFLERKNNQKAKLEQKKKFKSITKQMRKYH